jgi:hypothetical protein
MDPLYELASKLLQILDPEWGEVPVRRKTAERRFQRLHRLWEGLIRWGRSRRHVVVVLPPPPHRSAAAAVGATIRRLLEAQGQWSPAPTSIHLRRIIVTRALYDCPELALTAVRMVRQYPRYYEELAHDLEADPDVDEATFETLVAESNARLGVTGPRVPRLLVEIADRLTIDFQFAAAAADALLMPRPFSLVLFDEIEEIRRSRGGVGPVSAAPLRPPRLADDRLSRRPLSSRSSSVDHAHAAELVGLAVSGGGIRSATFSLGVIQALASLDLLRRFDYLSTVSGGGYIGSWLAAWIKRLDGGVREAQQRLSPQRGALPTEVEARPIRMLREYSNYLSPSVGSFSADTWTIAAVWLRNTVLNQLVLIAFLAAALLVPWLLLVVGADPVQGGWQFDDGVPLWTQWVLAGSFVVSVAAIGISLGDFDDANDDAMGATPKGLGWSESRIVVLVGGSLLTGAWLAAFVIVAMTSGEWELGSWVPLPDRPDAAGWLSGTEWTIAAIATAMMFLALNAVQVAGRYARCLVASERPGEKPRLADSAWAYVRLLAFPPVPAAVGGLLIALSPRIASMVATRLGGTSELVYQLVLLPPLLMEAVALTLVLHIGLLGRWLPDERREWWSRLGAHQLRLAFAWTAVGAIAVLVPHWMDAHFDLKKLLTAIMWLVTTLGGVVAAQAPATSSAEAPSLKSRLLEWLAHLAPLVFILGLLVAVSMLITRLLVPTDSVQVSIALGVFTVTGLVLSWRVDINEFSMHHFYKNRLVRCYLGASRDRSDRRANRFTGFDANDDIKLSQLRTEPDSDKTPYVGPYPLINTALNLTKGSELAWQERKAESFIFSPLACGYELTDSRVTGQWHLRRAGYRPTRRFAYRNGPGLGTAMAISGAAASPNMGYHSSPAVAFLLTVFNVRLGWWVGNPRYSAKGTLFSSPWRKSSPQIGALYLIKELFGRTDNQSRYVSLSDGGHFENLGVYELVRRRCCYIVAIDAEEDGDMTMGGLAGVIRKCRMDFGVTIDIDTKSLTRGPESRSHCAIGTITYPERPDRPGRLLYLKSSMTGDEPTDVREYDRRHEAFPHESTGDQWFDESQFESYRMLGFHIADDILRAAAQASGSGPRGVEDIFSYLRELWMPAGSGTPEDHRRHADAYAALIKRVHDSPASEFIDPALFPGMTEQEPAMARDVMYAAVEMIEYMHSIFIDLHLDRFGDRPHNAGWMRIFRMWAKSPAIANVWQRVGDSYSARFQRFVNNL